MTKMSTLSAVIILSAAVAMPAFAQDEAGVLGPGSRDRLETRQCQHTEEHERNLEDFGFSGKAPSRVGGEDPYLKPE
jgi:hypothetical protein